MKLIEMGIQDEVIQFYKHNEPKGECIEGCVRLWSIDRIIEESNDYLPGCLISRYGFIVIASSYGGDPYFIDVKGNLKGGPIRALSHEISDDEVDREKIIKNSIVAASGFDEFIEMFINDDVVEI